MDIGSLFFILALTIFVIAFVVRPLQAHESLAVGQEELTRSMLLAERDRILDSLSELEFDHGLGKVPEQIFPLQRDRLMNQGADVLRQIDQFGEEVISSSADISDDPIEKLIQERRQSKKSGSFCSNCGEPTHVDDRFCVACGTSLL